MRTTYITAAIIAVLILAWLFSGQLGEPEAQPPGSIAEQNAAVAARSDDLDPTRVRARVVHAQRYTEALVLRGRTENKRTVSVRAETGGRVVDRPVERGDRVNTGDLLCRISMDDRQAGLVEAQESLNQAQIEYQGSLKLKRQGFQSDTAIAQARARLASAKAQVERRQLEIQRTSIRAPFAGIVENTELEIGDFVSPGGACATIVDLNPMLLVAEVAEVNVAKVAPGTVVKALLVDGSTVEGQVTFVGQQSNPQTRTYRVEMQVDNADFALRSGITAEIRLPLQEVFAHNVSPALLALDDAGDIGVRTLDGDNRVEFHKVAILDDDPTGVWLTGLPTPATVITVGQELVIPGQLVDAELEAAPEMPAQAPAPRDLTPTELPEASEPTGHNHGSAEAVTVAAHP